MLYVCSLLAVADCRKVAKRVRVRKKTLVKEKTHRHWAWLALFSWEEANLR